MRKLAGILAGCNKVKLAWKEWSTKVKPTSEEEVIRSRCVESGWLRRYRQQRRATEELPCNTVYLKILDILPNILTLKKLNCTFRTFHSSRNNK